MINKTQQKSLLTAVLVAVSTVALFPQLASAQSFPRQLSAENKATADLAVSTLSKQLSLSPANISVIHVSNTNWPDSSLGCPQQGAQYLQVVTRGSLVLLRTNKRAYRIHIGNNRAIICDKPMRGIIPLGNKTAVGSSIQGQMQTARKDLAKKLGVSISEVFIVKVKSQTWPGQTLGCTSHEQDSPKKARVKGFLITMDYKGKEFNYHTGPQKVIPCPPIERE